MLRSTHTLRGFAIHATDGELGSINELLFDEEDWTVRYLVVNTGNWLLERLVLVSPIAIKRIDWDAESAHVELTREQVQHSPSIDIDRPISRQQEIEYLRYYNYPVYWGGAGLWGAGMYPSMLDQQAALMPPISAVPDKAVDESAPDDEEEEPTRSHLRSTREVSHYLIQAQDGEIGHVADFIFDDEIWAVRYLLVDTKNWLPGKQVLLSPRWIETISWAERLVQVHLLRDAIKQAPPYRLPEALDRDYERRLHEHYRYTTYWESEQAAQQA
jgi:uncharacterized protein YrrD